MWIELPDGWRDESSEGPYTEILQTKRDSTGRIWTISKLYDSSKIYVRLDYAFNKELSDLAIAKQYVEQQILNDKK